MEMDTWYELRFQQIFDLTDRANELLEDVKDTREGVASASALRIHPPSDFTGRASDLLGGDKGEN